MQLEQHFTVSAPPDVVWNAFHDPEHLVSCLPGASLRGPAENGQLPLLFKVKLGPIAAAFAGKGTLALDEAARTGVFSGQAADGKSNSRVKGEAAFSVEPDAAGTQVRVKVTFSITGSLTQFSREGIVRALGDQLTRQFAENLQALLVETSPPPAPVEEAAAPVADGAGQASPAPAPTGAETGAGTEPTEPAPRRAAGKPAPQAPALNVMTLLLAVIRGYWDRLWGRASR